MHACLWLLFLSLSLLSVAQTATSRTPGTPTAQQAVQQQPVQTNFTSTKGFVLEEETPVRLRLNRTISSADEHVGDNVDFEVLDDVTVNGTLVIPKGGLAFATVTEAQAKRRMARGGKLDINIDYVKLVSGEKAALRAVKDVKGGGHTGGMVGVRHNSFRGLASADFGRADPFRQRIVFRNHLFRNVLRLESTMRVTLCCLTRAESFRLVLGRATKQSESSLADLFHAQLAIVLSDDPIALAGGGF